MGNKPHEVDGRVSAERLRLELRALEGSLAGDLAHQIEVGSILWELDALVAKILDRIKDKIREAALQNLGGRVGICNFEGTDLGEVSVNLPESTLKLSRGRHLEGLKRSLGDAFSLYFEETTTYKPHKGFETLVAASLDPHQQKALLDAVERVEPTPRVSFKRKQMGET